jgi:hypothetical protein
MSASSPSATGADAQVHPPRFVLVQHANGGGVGSGAANTLTHPKIEYLYADDTPTSVLPRYTGEHVIVLDYDPNNNTTPQAQSVSSALTVSTVKVTDAPGVGLIDESNGGNNKIYVIETLGLGEDIKLPLDEPESDVTAAQTLLAHYRQRYAGTVYYKPFSPDL